MIILKYLIIFVYLCPMYCILFFSQNCRVTRSWLKGSKKFCTTDGWTLAISRSRCRSSTSKLLTPILRILPGRWPKTEDIKNGNISKGQNLLDLFLILFPRRAVLICTPDKHNCWRQHCKWKSIPFKGLVIYALLLLFTETNRVKATSRPFRSLAARVQLYFSRKLARMQTNISCKRCKILSAASLLHSHNLNAC